jgi:phenylalanyl-tRNA synthetase beta chain
MWPALIAKTASKGLSRYKPVSRHPAVERDLAIVVDRDIAASDLIHAVEEAGSLLSSANVFDVYEGEELGKNKRSIAISLSFKADRTLVDREVDAEIERIVKALASKWNARLRA